jgi:hypothetical chaperone protein
LFDPALRSDYSFAPASGGNEETEYVPKQLSIGVDFGTTNTVVAIARPGDAVRAVMFHDGRETSAIYRSVLLFEKGLSAAGLDLEAHAGLQAIRFYLVSIRKL